MNCSMNNVLCREQFRWKFQKEGARFSLSMNEADIIDGGKKALEQSSCLLPFEIESKSDSLSSLAPLFFLPIYRWVRIIFGIKTVYDR